MRKTQAENVRNVNGYYCGGFIGIVTRSDANKLADALQKALTNFAEIDKICSTTGIKKVIDLRVFSQQKCIRM